MTIRNRETLRHFFDEGKLPTRDHFGDLIDSMLNMSDEGFRKSVENGLEISSPIGYDALISFYRDQNARSALWSIGHGGDQEQLVFRKGRMGGDAGRAPVMALATQNGDAQVGIGTAHPRHTLEVDGFVSSRGRRGSYRDDDATPLLADGEWHSLTPVLNGCHAFEVMAGVGEKGTGRYALLHAIAMNAFHPRPGWFDFLSRKRRIRTQCAWYGKRCDQLELRWHQVDKDKPGYRLQIRTRCEYGPGIAIQASLTQLWSNDFTQGDPS